MNCDIPILDGTKETIVNIKWKRGKAFAVRFEYFTDNTFSTELDITSSTFKMVVVNQAKQPYLTFTMSSGLSITAPNKLNFSKTANDMLIPAGVYLYELKNLTTGNVGQSGKFIIEDNIL